MKCTGAKSKMVDLLYRELNTEQQQLLTKHMGDCAACRAEWNSLKAAHGWLNCLEHPAEQPRLNVSAVQRRVVRQKERRRRRRRTVGIALSLIAAVSVLIAAGWNLRCEIHATHVVLSWQA